jgi:hypothetical protein
MTAIQLINLFESVFTTSFKHTASMLYNVTFETSNVTITQKKLTELEENFKSGINTRKHVGLQITLEDITIVRQSLNSLIIAYELIYGISMLPSKLKLHEMFKELRENGEKKDVTEMAKEVLDKILVPEKAEKKLTKKEKMQELVDSKTKERQLQMIKKHNKQ